MAESYTSLRGGPELESGSLTLKPTLSTTKPQHRLSVYPYLERISKLKFKLSQEMKPPPHHAPSLFVIGFEDACALSHAPTSPPFPGKWGVETDRHYNMSLVENKQDAGQ